MEKPTIIIPEITSKEVTEKDFKKIKKLLKTTRIGQLYKKHIP